MNAETKISAKGLDIPMVDITTEMQDQIFTHIDAYTLKVRNFNASAMYRIINAMPERPETVRVNVEGHMAQWKIKWNMVSKERCDQMHPLQAMIPVLFAVFPEEDTHLLIDGTHRYVRRWMLGYDDILAYLLPPDLWQKCLRKFPVQILEVTLRDMYGPLWPETIGLMETRFHKQYPPKEGRELVHDFDIHGCQDI